MLTPENTTKINTVLMDKLGVSADKLTPEATIAGDLGADSLDQIEMVMALEDEFNIEIPDHEAETLTTVKAVYDYVDTHTTA